MADRKISQLDLTASLAGNEQLVIVQPVSDPKGNKRVTIDQIKQYVGEGISASALPMVVTSGTNTYTGTIPTLPLTNKIFRIQISNNNTGPSTLNAKPLKKNVDDDLVADDLKAGGIYIVHDDGTNYQIIGGFLVPDASETVKGIVEFVTASEARDEDDNTRALTPHSLRATGGGLGVEIARTLTDSETLLITDLNRKVVFNISSIKNLTIPASVFAAGDIVYVERTGSGTLNFVAGSGMTLTSSLGALTDAGENNLVILLFDSSSSCKIYNGIPFNLTSNDVINALGYSPSKRILLYKNITENTHTGNTTETILGQYLVPAGTIQADDILVIRGRAAKSGSAGSYNVRIRIGSAGTTSDTQVAIVSPGATQLGTYFKRDIHFENSVSAQEILNTTLNAATDEQTTSTAPSDLTINFANQQYISVSINLNNSSDTAILKYFYIEIIRS